MPIYLYNTLTQKKEIFKPSGRVVKMYVCGPTVNDVPHLGHARQQITFDVLRKILRYNDLEVESVSNITDIDDKIINKANELGEDIQTLTERNLKAHLTDYASLNVAEPDVQPRATEYVREMVSLVKLLEKKGYTYVINGDGVYFDISKFKEYGKLSHQKTENLFGGARIKVKEEKKNKEDFVLWKFAKAGEPSYESPWGEGRPGWHIECSAMSHEILGLPLDIHGGGQDLIFPHHEDELAQSEAAYGKQLARFWVHNGMVNVDSVKMSKSLGNFTTIRDLLKEYSGEMIRYFVFNVHYRKPLDFTKTNLNAAKNAYEKLVRKVSELRKESHKGVDSTKKYEAQFLEAINDDMNMPKALQVMWTMLDEFNFDPKKKLKLLERFDTVLGLNIKDMKETKVSVPKEVRELIEERERFRSQKKWKDADLVREKIKDLGYSIEDSAEGVKVSKI